MPEPAARPGASPPPQLPRRFYTAVSVAGEADGFAVQLDRRPVRTPGRCALKVPNAKLAEAIASEWDAQREVIDPATMLLTKIANTAIDQIPDAHDRVVDDVAAFAATDLLLYRADGPAGLVDRQAATWDPVVQTVEQRLNRGRFLLAEGVMHVTQPAALVDGVRTLVAESDPFGLAALHVITTLTGSALLALAVRERTLDIDSAWAAAHVDEDWQIAHWGSDDQATARRAGRRREFDAAVTILDLA